VATAAFDNGFLVVMVRYVITCPDGSLFYQRRVPKGLEGHHGGKRLLRQSLGTKSIAKAAPKARELAAQHDALWKMLRNPEAARLGVSTQEVRAGARAVLESLGVQPGGIATHPWYDDSVDDYLAARYGDAYLEVRHDPRASWADIEQLLTPIDKEAVQQFRTKRGEKRYYLTDALSLYLGDHIRGEEKKFRQDTQRSIQRVIDTVGDLPLDKYDREQARKVVEALGGRGNKTGTVRRQLRTINAVFNHGIREFDLKTSNPFRELKIKGEGEDEEARKPFTIPELSLIQHKCYSEDDDIRHIVAMQSDLGCRAGEVIGLQLDDVFLDAPVPHVWFRADTKVGRTLKTATSERKVPLVGAALWAAKRAVERAKRHRQRNGWLFPRYASAGEVRATSAETQSTSGSGPSRASIRPHTASGTRCETDCVKYALPKKSRMMLAGGEARPSGKAMAKDVA